MLTPQGQPSFGGLGPEAAPGPAWFQGKPSCSPCCGYIMSSSLLLPAGSLCLLCPWASPDPPSTPGTVVGPGMDRTTSQHGRPHSARDTSCRAQRPRLPLRSSSGALETAGAQHTSPGLAGERHSTGPLPLSIPQGRTETGGQGSERDWPRFAAPVPSYTAWACRGTTAWLSQHGVAALLKVWQPGRPGTLWKSCQELASLERSSCRRQALPATAQPARAQHR